MFENPKHKLFLIGYPIRHSLSPHIMNYIFKENDVNAVYSLYEIESGLDSVVKGFREDGIYGFNVTIPYKEEIIKHLDIISPEAGEIGAVNTVHNLEGMFIGHNTDWLGVYKPITRFGGDNFDRALIIGAGGAAKAAVYALKDLVKNVYIANRTFSRALELSRRFQRFFREAVPLRLTPKDLGDVVSRMDIIINATPVGIRRGEKPIPTDRLGPDTIVFDMIYRPLETELIREAREKGLKTIDGLWMLIYQAVEAVKIWFGVPAEVERIRRYIVEEVL